MNNCAQLDSLTPKERAVRYGRRAQASLEESAGLDDANLQTHYYDLRVGLAEAGIRTGIERRRYRTLELRRTGHRTYLQHH
jgi:hypothetical protein